MLPSHTFSAHKLEHVRKLCLIPLSLVSEPFASTCSQKMRPAEKDGHFFVPIRLFKPTVTNSINIGIYHLLDLPRFGLTSSCMLLQPVARY